MHALGASLHAELIDPGSVRIVLPFDDWWKLWCALDRKYRWIMKFDGRGDRPTQFKYMGFTFEHEPRAKS